jgi:hypothetical protein
MTELGLYVYGLVAGDELAGAPELPGIDGTHAVECVRQGEICALVSRVSLEQFEEKLLREKLADMGWVEQTARRHQRVLGEVLHDCTPLPMRLCTLYSDEDGLRGMLDSRRQELSAELSELRGKLEWGVQAFARPRSQSDVEPLAAASGSAYLRQRLADRQAGEAAYADLGRLCDDLHHDLCAVAVAGRLGMPQRPEASGRELPMILNASYLVANDQRDRFGECVADRGAELVEQGVELQLTGPWPPYNFVSAVVGGGR